MKKIVFFVAAALISTAAMAQGNYKFAHANFYELIQLMPEMDSARVQIEAVQKESQETYEAMVQEWQTKYADYEQKQGTWTTSIRQSKERELAEIQNRIQDFEQSIQQELQQLQNQLMNPIYQKAQEAIRAAAKAGGYIYVFDSSQQNPLYIGDQSVDLTPSLRKTLGIPEGRTLEALQQEMQARAAQQQ